MNIRAVMAALDIDDLDRAAKAALVMLACRADRYTGLAEVSLPRMAADLAVHYQTARHALERLVQAGYLTVDKTPGKTSIWMLTPRVVRGVPRELSHVDPASDTRGPRESPAREGVFREKQRSAAARVPHGGAVDKRRLAVVAPNAAPPPDWTAHLPNWTRQRLAGDTQGDC